MNRYLKYMFGVGLVALLCGYPAIDAIMSYRDEVTGDRVRAPADVVFWVTLVVAVVIAIVGPLIFWDDCKQADETDCP